MIKSKKIMKGELNRLNSVYTSNSPAETRKIASELATKLNGGEVIAFYGDLGQGKTCFVTGLAEGLGYKGEVSSPTFAIINEYIGGRLALYHFDMYRVNGWDDLYSTSYFEYMESGGVLAVEWSENVENALPDDSIKITIKRIDESKREITIVWGDDV